MAHFAELDGSNKVIRVIVVSNDITTAAGPLGDNDMHIDGETWCTNLLGGSWKQTSYNDKFRKQYAGMGMTYDAAKDKFIRPQPFASWTLDGDDSWEPTVAGPNDSQMIGYEISWNEDLLRFEAEKDSDDSKHRWDSSGSVWVAL